MANFKSTCRCCATDVTDTNNLTNLFTNIDETLKVAEVLQMCSGLSVLPTDRRPQQICQTCRLDLWKAYSFRKRCEHSEICFQFQLPSPIPIDYIRQSPHPQDTYKKITSTSTESELQLWTVDNSQVISCKKELIEFEQENTDYDGVEEYLRVESIVIEPATAADFQLDKYSVSPKRRHQFKRRRITEGELKSNQTKTTIKSDVNIFDKKYLSCDICSRRFDNKSSLVHHMRIHADDKPFECNICDKSFRQSGTLNTHLTLHTGKPHLCQICGKRFSRQAFLKVHVRTHTGNLPYKCADCAAEFAQKCALVTHRERHHSDGNNVFKCEVCGKAYNSRATLRWHRFSHYGYPYKCSICGGDFSRKSSLQNHLVNVHLIVENALQDNDSDQMMCEVLESNDFDDLTGTADDAEYLE